jgi:hypothetical protein
VLFLVLAARTLITALFVIGLVWLNSGEPHRAPAIWAGGPIKRPLARIKDTELRHDAPAKSDLLENINLAPWVTAIQNDQFFPVHRHANRYCAAYRSGPSKTWIKVKNPKAPAATRAIDGFG